MTASARARSSSGCCTTSDPEFREAQQPCAVHAAQGFFRALLPALLQQLRDQGCPTRLMARAQPGRGVPVEILMEQDVVAEIRVGLKLFVAAENRPPAICATDEDARQPARQLRRGVAEIHPASRPRRKFHL